MKWTADKPTAPGKYWFRDKIMTGKQLAHVYEAEDDGESGLYAQTDMGGGWVKYLEDCEWAGPLPEPPDLPPLS